MATDTANCRQLCQVIWPNIKCRHIAQGIIYSRCHEVSNYRSFFRCQQEQAQHPPLVQAYAEFEVAAGNYVLADSLFAKYEALLGKSDVQDLRKTQ
jgi:hypothetical protein